MLVASHVDPLSVKAHAFHFEPCPLLREHVAAGRLGRKSGEGFYSYS